MAIIYTYPNLPLSSLSAEDLLVITNVDATNNNPTRSVTLADIATYVTGTGSGTGTTNKIVKFTDGANGLLGDSIMNEDVDKINLNGILRIADNNDNRLEVKYGTDSSTTHLNNAPASNHIIGRAGDLFIKNRARTRDILFQADDGQYDGNVATYFRLDGSMADVGTTSYYTRWGNNSHIVLGNSANTNSLDFSMYHDGSDTYLINGSSFLYVESKGGVSIENKSGGSGNIEIIQSVVDADIEIKGSNGNYFKADTSAGATIFSLPVEVPLIPAANANAASKQYVDQQISSVASGLVFISTWDASSAPGGNPDLTAADKKVVGHYYVVSVAGSATPNGVGTLPNSWNVGDWCIYVEQGATDRWEKLDQTFVSGAGAAGQVTFWNSQNEVAGDNNFFWNNTSKRLGVGTNAPQVKLHVAGTGAPDIRIQDLDGTNQFISIGHNNGSTTYVSRNNTSFGTHVFYGANGSVTTERMRIDSAGDIFISPRATAASSGSGILYFKNVDDNSATINGGSIRTVDSTNNPSGADMRFQVANDSGTLFDAVTIDSNGFMGIGTTAPDYYLDVSTSARINSSLSNGVQLVIDNSNTTDAGTETSELRFRHYRSYVAGQNDAGSVIVGKEEAWDAAGDRNSYMSFGTRAGTAGVTEKMRITSAGNVGIGTTTPLANLDISNDLGTVYQQWSYDNPGAGNYNLTLSETVTAGNVRFCFNQRNAGVNYSDVLVFNQGNVGIGIDNSATKLHVSSGIGRTDTNKNYTQFISSNDADDFLFGMAIAHKGGTTSSDRYVSIDSVSYKKSTSAFSTSGDLVLQQLGSNVGIGTTSPYAKLSVKDGTDINLGIKIGQTDPTAVMLNAYNDAVTANIPMEFRASKFNFENGNVGIGTTTPGEKFTVEGDGSYMEITHPTATSFSGIKFSEGGTPQGSIQSIGSTFATTARRDNFEIFHNTGGNLTLQHSGGNVGIGTTSPLLNLQINSVTDSNATIAYSENNTLKWYTRHNASDDSFQIVDVPNATAALNIASGGNVGIGTTSSPGAKLEVANAAEGTYLIVGGDNASNSRALAFTSSTSGLTNGALHTINAQSGNGIIALATTSTERMRVDNAGNVLFGTTGIPNGTSVYGSGFIQETDDRATLFLATSRSTAAALIIFKNPNGTVGSIFTNGSATTFNTSSDYRLKKDLKDFDGFDKVSKIPVYDFKWKVDNSSSYGVMAHELQDVLPDAVSGEKDGEEMQGVDYSKIVPLLIKSIQELEAKVKILENK